MDIGKGKKLSVTFSPEIKDPCTYDVFLIKTDEDHLEIQLAIKSEKEDSVTLDVKEIFSISADNMFSFCMDIATALMDYEKKYHNGKGWPALPNSSGTEKK